MSVLSFEGCLKALRAVTTDLIKRATNTEGSGAGDGLVVADEEKSRSAAYLKGREVQAYEKLMKSLKGERQNLKINMVFNRGAVKLPRTDVFFGWSIGNVRTSRSW